jgi:hypothetical protein
MRSQLASRIRIHRSTNSILVHCEIACQAGTIALSVPFVRRPSPRLAVTEVYMNGIIYLIGLIVVVLAILSFFGLH